MVTPNPLIGKLLEDDVVGGDLLVVSAEEVEANKLVFNFVSPTPANDLVLPPKLNPPLSDGLLASLEGLELIAAPPNPAKGNEGASASLLFDVVPPKLKSLFGNREFAADDDPEALPLDEEGNDAPKDEPNILISDIMLY